MTIRLPAEIPVEEYPKPEVFVNEADALVKETAEKGWMLRVMGGVAIYMHCREYEALWKSLDRLGPKVFMDIDFVGYGKHRNSLYDFFQSKGYKTDPRFLYQFGKDRHIFFGGTVPEIEIFYDRLVMNHTVPYERRLEMDSPTVPLGELLMQKLEIVKINDKDIKDLVILIRAHELGEDDKEKINLNVFDNVGLFNEWGWYHTATANLGKTKVFANGSPVLSEQDKKVVGERVDRMLAFIEQKPKSIKWRMRAKLGEKAIWYNPVEDWD